MTAFELIAKVKENVSRVIVGKDNVTELLLIALLSGGHVLIEDVPGSGKTMLSKAFAVSLDCEFKRIQFTPDLLPSDVTGIKYFNMKTSEFEFLPGPVFSNILLADEINRATPKTQSGLLECMEEKQATIDGDTYKTSDPFMVVATQNPVESMGVFPLPEAQLDRFFIKTRMGYPSREESVDIIRKFGRSDPLKHIRSVVTKDDIFKAAKEIDNIFAHEDLFGYISDIAEATRKKDEVILGVSVRGCISLLKASKGMAAVRGRDYVLPDDIKSVAIPALAHRLILKTSMISEKNAAEKIIGEVLNEVAVPTEDFARYKL